MLQVSFFSYIETKTLGTWLYRRQEKCWGISVALALNSESLVPILVCDALFCVMRCYERHGMIFVLSTCEFVIKNYLVQLGLFKIRVSRLESRR